MNDEEVTILISKETAIALKTVLDCIGGCPATSARGLLDDLSRQLDGLGIPEYEIEEAICPSRRAIYFRKAQSGHLYPLLGE